MTDIFTASEDAYRPPSPNEARIRQRMLASRLQSLFEPAAEEPVPGDFLDILRQADRR